MNGFWQDKRVLITGHTGFKGSWLSLLLTELGASVIGVSLEQGSPLFESFDLRRMMDHRTCDICDYDKLRAVVVESAPEITFHLAAQSLVLPGYENPMKTWETNVLGSVHVMEALRDLNYPGALVMVTTDKVYLNNETAQYFAENDPLGGHDPYSSSKAAMEIAIDSWRKSFRSGSLLRMASARAGNVIGGGDWAHTRIVPDIARAFAAGRPIQLRNPAAIRPWQHVLDPLNGYLKLAEKLMTSEARDFEGAFNFGPDPEGARSVLDLVVAASEVWPGTWELPQNEPCHHEAGTLQLDTGKARDLLNHMPRWGFQESVHATMIWYKSVAEGANPRDVSVRQLRRFGAI